MPTDPAPAPAGWPPPGLRERLAEAAILGMSGTRIGAPDAAKLLAVVSATAGRDDWEAFDLCAQNALAALAPHVAALVAAAEERAAEAMRERCAGMASQFGADVRELMGDTARPLSREWRAAKAMLSDAERKTFPAQIEAAEEIAQAIRALPLAAPAEGAP